MDFSRELNKEQCWGVTSPSQYIKCVAGAGSGKTRVLTYRIAHLIANCNVLPSQVLGITFTNKAAKEIKDRVIKLVPDAENMALSTIHSWCARFLRIYAGAIDYPRNFSILDDDDQLSVMKNIFVNHGLAKNDPHIKECLAWIGGKKTEGIQYKDLEGKHFPNPLLNQFLIYFKEYTEILKKSACMDFDDLLLFTIDILAQEENGIRASASRRYTHILVDEFQDINDVQFHLITLLMNKDTNLYVVGDPDQTIYTWRGANNKIMIDLEKSLRYHFPKAEVETIILKNNYRSSKKILTAANELISHNKDRIEKDLIATNPDGEDITYHNARTEGEETSFIASTIKELVRREGKKYSDFAILYRSNYLTRALESQLNLHRVPYRIFGAIKFYQRKEIKDVLAYLTLVDNVLADPCFERIINVPSRNIGPTSVEKIKAAANEVGQPLFIFAKENLDMVKLPPAKKDAISRMIKMIEGLNLSLSVSESKDYGDIVKKFLEDIGYFSYLKEDEDGDEREENVNELIGSIQSFFADNPTALFEEFITNAALQASADEVNDGDFVTLMTVHMAKGLEFNTVFIYEFADGVFPSQRAIDESSKGIEEERRLAYVAITRAKRKLYLTCNQEFSFVCQTKLRPSRFIEEAGIKTKKTYFSSTNNYSNTYINPNKNSSYQRPMQEKKQFVPKAAPKPQTNGVTQWFVGDKLIHETFGTGVVVNVISDKLIEVKFDDPSVGKKALLGNHVKIKKIVS